MLKKMYPIYMVAIAIVISSCKDSKAPNKRDGLIRQSKSSAMLTDIKFVSDSIVDEFIKFHQGRKIKASYSIKSTIKHRILKSNIDSWTILGFVDTMIQSKVLDFDNKIIALRRYCKMKSSDFSDYNSCLMTSEIHANIDTVITVEEIKAIHSVIDTALEYSREMFYYNVELGAIAIHPFVSRGNREIYITPDQCKNVWKLDLKGKWIEIKEDSLKWQINKEEELIAIDPPL